MIQGISLSKIVCTQLSVDTMLKDTHPPRYAVRRTHRTYTPQFKAGLVAACMQPAALALQHGMNANVLHRWLKEYHQGHHRLHAVGSVPDVQPQTTPSFIPIALSAAAPSCSGEQPVATVPAMAPDIRIECQHLGMSVTVHWPIGAAAQCAQMLRELLR